MTLLLLLVGASWAATLQVGPTRTYTTIQGAVDAASDGDRIEIDAGTYAEDVDLGGLDLTVVGAGSGSTVLEVTGTGIDATSGESLVVEGLTLRNGARGIDATGEVTLTDVLFSGIGDGTEDGAALRVVDGTLDWTTGSAYYCEASLGVVYLEEAVATLDGVDLQYGKAVAGGGLYAVDSTIELVDVGLVKNQVSGDGGGLYLDGGSLLGDSVRFTASIAGGMGGGLYASGTGITLAGPSFEQCYASVGGGLFLDESTSVFEDSSFLDNEAATVADIRLVSGSLSLTDTSIEGSTATEYYGEDEAISFLASSSSDLVLDGLEMSVDSYSAKCDCGRVTLSDLTLTGTLDTSWPWQVDAEALTLHGSFSADSPYEVGEGAGGPVLFSGIDSVVLSGASFSGGQWFFRGILDLEDLSAEQAVLSLDPWEAITGHLSSVSLTDSLLEHWDDTLVIDDLVGTGSHLRSYGTSLTLTDVILEDAPDSAIRHRGGGELLATRLTVRGSTGTPPEKGGALHVESGTATLHRAWLGECSATAGGAIAIDAGTIDLAASVLYHNTAVDGGAIWTGGGDVSLHGVILQDNSADDGAALYVDGAFPLVYNTTIVGNQAYDGGVVHLESGYVGLVDTIVAHNADGYGLYASSGSTSSTIRYDDFWNNADGSWGGTFSDLTGTDGNIAQDPLFVAWSDDSSQLGDDLHLASGSPCIDSGYPGWADPDGSVSDMGAFGGTYAEDIDYDGDLQLASEGDCDDSDASTWDGAEEVPYDGADNDCAGDGDATDLDGDGHDAVEAGGDDCDDTDAAVNPDAEEVWYDGVDSDCSGGSDYDRDGDGHDSVAYGGDDCDDQDHDIHPGAEETWYDGVDSDCSGGSDYDQDGDGYDSAEHGGDDPDDTDPDVGPGDVDTSEPVDTGEPDDTDEEDEDVGRCGCKRRGMGGTFAALLLVLPLAGRRRRA